MRVYQFKTWRRNFCVDVESGNFFEVDKVASDTLALLENHTEKEIMAKLARNYGRRAVAATFKKLARLREENILFSKRQRRQVNTKRNITDLTLNIVNNCNLRCRYCWNQAGSYGRTSEGNIKMAYPVAKSAVDLLIKESGAARDLVVDFYGGEPLLNFGLIQKTILYCQQIKARSKINFRFLLATNGTLLTRDKAEFMIKNGVDIAVSIDGSRKIQDIQRPFPNGKGSFGKISNNINSLKDEYRARLVGRATFTPHSRDVIKTFKFLRNLGFDRIEVCESEKAGYDLESRNRFFFCGSQGREQLKSLYDKLAKFYTREIIKGNLTYENTYFNRFFKQLSRLYHIQSIVGTCSAGFSLMAVDMDGSIYPCTAFVGIPQFKIGTVNTGIGEKKLKAFLNTRICSSEVCERCWAKRLCQGCGSCYNLNYFTNKNLGQPDTYYCDLFCYKTKLMIAMIAEIAQKSPRLLESVLVPEYYATRGKRNNNEDKENISSKASEIHVAGN